MTKRHLIAAAAIAAAAILPATASAADSVLLVGVADHMAATAQLGSCSTDAACAKAGMRGLNDVSKIATRMTHRLTVSSSPRCKRAAVALVPVGQREIRAAKAWIAHPTNGTLGAYYTAARAFDKVSPGLLAC